MDLLNAATACALFFSAPGDCPKSAPVASPRASAIAPWEGIIGEAARRFSIPDDWIGRVMAAESGGHTMLNGQPITSSKGAMGLMQLMPETWLAMRQRYGLGSDPYNPHDNIFAGAAYLRAMRDRFGAEGVFAAYNSGPSRYSAYLAGARSLPAETKIYLAKLGSGALPGVKSMQHTTIFVAISTTSPQQRPVSSVAVSHTALSANAHDLFVPLSGDTR